MGGLFSPQGEKAGAARHPSALHPLLAPRPVYSVPLVNPLFHKGAESLQGLPAGCQKTLSSLIP